MSPPPSRKIVRLHRAVLRQVDELLELAGDPQAIAGRVPAVSGWSVGQHLDHLAKAGLSVVTALERAAAGELEERGGRPTWIGRLVLLTGYIPRGRGKAPERTRPSAEPQATYEELDQLRQRLAALDGELGRLERSRATVPHPFFGPLRPAQWLRFLDVHHRHHLKIIRDLRAAA
ncbi:MAG: DinB family protein [Acidobacteria bacterium]|nr:MAG: DinB family protein [Acidobacteriota bacterium]